MGDKKKMVEVTATYQKDSKRYRRYEVKGDDIVGTLYVAKEKKAPESIIVNFED